MTLFATRCRQKAYTAMASFCIGVRHHKPQISQLTKAKQMSSNCCQRVSAESGVAYNEPTPEKQCYSLELGMPLFETRTYVLAILYWDLQNSGITWQSYTHLSHFEQKSKPAIISNTMMLDDFSSGVTMYPTIQGLVNVLCKCRFFFTPNSFPGCSGHFQRFTDLPTSLTSLIFPILVTDGCSSHQQFFRVRGSQWHLGRHDAARKVVISCGILMGFEQQTR